MNIQSYILIAIIAIAFIIAIIYMVKNNTIGSCCGKVGGKMQDCDGDCSKCQRMK